MKTILITLSLFYISLCSAQNIKAVYTKTFLAMVGDNTAVPKELKPSLHSFEYSKGKSLYKISSSVKSSVKMVDMETQGMQYKSKRTTIVPDEDTYYKDTKNNIFRKEYSDGENVYSIKDKLEVFNWKLTNETAVIKGYKCKKATTVVTSKYLNREFPTYAWYSEDIPVNDGPSFYWGLPGLIIEVNMDGKYVISLTDLEIVKEDIIIKEPVNKTEMITREELDKRW
jgi:GLPGLI family protein